MDNHLNLRQSGIAGQNESPIDFENFSRKVLWFVLFAIFTAELHIELSYAQAPRPDFKVSGLVVDSLSGKSLPFVTIQIQNGDEIIKRLSSDDSGNFSFVLNSSGKYDLLFHSVGYQQKKTAIISTESSSMLDFGKVALSPSSEQVDEVTVSAIRPLVRNESEKLIYSVETDPESKTGNVLGMLRKVPLVSVDGNDNVQLRGMSGVKFLINGKSSAALDRNTREVLRNMPSNTIKDIEVMTNPSSKYEAEGSAGIINIVTTRRVSDGYNGSVSAGLNTFGQYNGNVNFASKINKFVYSLNAVMNHFEGPVSFSESTRENFFSTTNRYTESNGSNKGFGNWNSFNSEASYEIDTLNLVSVSFNGNLSENEGLFLSKLKDFDLSHAATSGYEKTGIFIGDWKNFTGTFDYQKLFNRKDRIFTFSYRYDHGLQDANHNDKYVGLLNFPDYWQHV
ncbi:MAG: carboxypeptidase-like regulatory domain-containing protein, partial [Flavobacteriaceae bacterium]|nr:carboxypeptidase-like regulatory domain-containing protein [Flavobacteriaceae bacterium]